MSIATHVRYDDAVEIAEPDEEATIGDVLEVFPGPRGRGCARTGPSAR